MTSLTRRLSVEASWRRLGRGALAGVDVGLARWLRDDSSLTRRVMRACGGRFSVELIGHGRAKPLPSERRLLAVPAQKRVLVREVVLRCDGHPWVFARTLIPLRSLRGPALRLAALGVRPLGEVLFADPTTQRRRVEVGRLGPRHPLFARAMRNLDHTPKVLWARRTLFRYAGRPLLVNEIFLPDIPAAR